MYACLAVTCHLHYWQNDRHLLRATAVTRGWNEYRNKCQHRKSTLEKKILPPLLQGFQPATFQSRVRRSNPAPTAVQSCFFCQFTCSACPFWSDWSSLPKCLPLFLFVFVFIIAKETNKNKTKTTTKTHLKTTTKANLVSYTDWKRKADSKRLIQSTQSACWVERQKWPNSRLWSPWYTLIYWLTGLKTQLPTHAIGSRS